MDEPAELNGIAAGGENAAFETSEDEQSRGSAMILITFFRNSIVVNGAGGAMIHLKQNAV